MSRLSDIAERSGKGEDCASVYRNRLRKAGMVVANAPGEADFAQSLARGWVRHSAQSGDALLS